jgi:undecaprenyl-diphosphatase
MEDILNYILLGIIQGLTEFLPVSSSGHLEIAKEILHNDSLSDENQSMLVTVALHGATALSTIVIFRKDIAEIFKGLFSFQWNEESQFAVKIVLSMFPAVIIGLVFNDLIETFFAGNMLLVGSCLVLTAGLLYLADKSKSTTKDVTFTHSIIIGVSQAIAILPGISRSGATISTAVLLGIDKTKAARFSFLMVVPVILGKMAKDVMGGDFSTQNEQLLPLALGFIAAFVTGLVACTWMIKIVQKSQLKYFSFYCLAVGAVAITYSFI